MVESIPKIGLQVLEIPITLVMLDKSYEILLQIQNLSQITGPFKIFYEGNGLEIKSSDLINKELSISPNSSEIDRIQFIPRQKGMVSLRVKVTYLKEVLKEITRIIEPSTRPNQPELPATPSEIPSETLSALQETESLLNELSDILPPEILEDNNENISELPQSPSTPQEFKRIVEKVKEIVEVEIFSTPIYINALDKESSAALKKFAKKGDSNILTSEMGLPLCLCYFYSEIQDKKWKIRPVLIRNLCIRMKEKFGKLCYYISYPLSKQFDNDEISIIQEAVQTFILPQTSSSHPMLFLNIDIIPEFKKPSIIIGYEQTGLYNVLMNQLNNLFGSSVDIFMDDSIFSGGLFYNSLTKWTGPSQSRVINIVLSNNFVSNIQLFQNLLESLITFILGGSFK